MFEKFEVQGEFWIPKSDIDPVPGILSYSPQEGGRLQLFGTIQGGTSHYGPLFIHGYSIEGERITLFQCQHLGSERNVALKISRSKYYSNFVFKGIHFNNQDSLQVNSIHADFSHLDDWLWMSRFKTSLDEDTKGFTITFSPPEPLEYKIDDTTKLVIGSTYHLGGGSLYEAKAFLTPFISFFGPIEDYSYYANLVILFQYFLSLAVTSPIYPKSIKISGNIRNDLENQSEDTSFNLADVYYIIPNSPEELHSIHSAEMLFPYKDIEDTFEKLVQNWYQKHDLLGTIYDLYFGAINSPLLHRDFRFLSLAQGLESYHRRTSSLTVMNKKEYNKMKDEILSKCPEYKDILEQLLPYAKRPSFRERLLDLADKYKKTLVPMVGAYEIMIAEVTNTRHYLTHWDEEDKEKAVTGSELGGLVQNLSRWIEAILLCEMGFDYEQVIVMQRERRRLPYW